MLIVYAFPMGGYVTDVLWARNY